MPDRINHSFQQSHGVLNDKNLMTNEKWQAIIDNDASYNNQFFYAVKTTGIFCKPSCKSRVPKKKMYVFFQTQNKLSMPISALVNVASLRMRACLIVNGWLL